jgi:PGF-CTERM protein
MNAKPLVVALLLVASVTAPVAAAGAETTQEGQAGAFVSFEAESNAVVDYTVDGTTVVENVSVQSESEASGGSSVDLGSSADFSGAGLSVASSMQASGSATIQSESGATIESHDNQRGVLVVRPGGGSQVAAINLSSDAEAESESEGRVVIEKDDGTQAVVLATGDAEVTVTDEGDVEGRTGENGQLVYRQYDGERSDSDESQEQFIANGTATAELYYQQASESGDSGSDRAVNVVNYGQDTTVEVTERSASTLNATVERSQSEGKVVLVSVSEAAMENAESTSVYVDGEAAAEASSYSEVAAAANGGDNSAFLVRSSSSAEATTDVVVGVNHFSERELSMQSDGGDGATSSGGQPGFGVGIAVVALAGAALLAARQ